MKRIATFILSVSLVSIVSAQDITDAVRYSDDNIQGTARFRALSGAFGALGSDMSAVSINPAGSALFNTSHSSTSMSYSNSDNTTSYFGTRNSNSNSNFDIGQLGVAFVFKNINSQSPWQKFVVSFNYERNIRFNNNFFASGTNTNDDGNFSNSIASYFYDYAQGLRLDEIKRLDGETITEAYNEIGFLYGYGNQQAFLGYESFILEPETEEDNNTAYTSNISPGNFYHEYSYYTSGSNNKLSFNGAFKYNDNLYLGINLNSHFLNYRRSTYLFESNDNVGSIVREVGFENNLETIGTGFSFQLGGIVKLNEFFRIGATYDSPVWYNMNDETTQYLTTLHDYFGNGLEREVLDPRVVNVFERYRIQTPSKITGSLAIIFGKRGLISFDYSRKDFSKSKFKPTNDSYFSQLNSDISSALKAANTYRIGGELKHKQISFRGGYRLEQSPYRNTNFYGDLTGFSLGLGYNFGIVKLDFAYENFKRDLNQQLYQVGLTESVQINRQNDNFTLSLSSNF